MIRENIACFKTNRKKFMEQKKSYLNKLLFVFLIGTLISTKLLSTCAVTWSASATWNGLNWGVSTDRYTVNSTVNHGGNEYRCIAIPGFNCSPTDATYGTTYWTYLGSCSSAPTITTTAISSTTCGGASSGGNTISDGGASITAKGVCWNTSTNPTTSNSKTSNGTGTANFSASLTGLSAGTTYYVRAYATNSVGTSYGANVSFTTLSATTAGSIGSAQTICSGGTPAGLTQTGAAGGGNGSYTYLWQSSTDNSSWGSATGTNNASTYSPGSLTTSTYYRRQATSSDCGTANSASILMTINATSVGGSVSSSATVCTGSNSGTLTLSGHTGSVTKWQYSTDGGSNWTDIANTTTSQAYTNLTATRIYRAVVTSGVCSSANSSTATITVSPTTVGGSVTSDATVCTGSNGATLTLSGHTGSIVRWESSSASNFASPTTISNTGTTQAYSNLTATTYYRAVVQSGACSSANSNYATITVTPTLSPGVIKF